MRREGLGSYALGVALTGKSANEIKDEIYVEEKQIRDLINQLSEKTGVHPIKLRDRAMIAFCPGGRLTKVEFLQSLVDARPHFIKIRLNLKNWEYNPEGEDDQETVKMG